MEKADGLDVQKSKAVTFVVESYFTDTVRLEDGNKRLNEQLGFLRSEFDKIHREIQQPLKLLAACTENSDKVAPTPQQRTFLDKLLRRNKSNVG